MILDDMIKALPKLRPDELERLSRSITALRQFGDAPTMGATAGRLSPDKEMLLQIVHEVLQQFGVPAPYPVLRSAATGDGFTLKLETLMKFCGELTKQEKFAVLRVGMGLLVTDLQQIGIALTPGTVCRCLHRIPAVINRAFPNYARNGLLKHIAGTRMPAYD